MRVVVIKPDTVARTRTAAHQDRAADAHKTLALMFNEKTPATKPTIKRRDGMKLREKARQQFVAREGIIAAKRHLYLTR